MTVTSDSWSSVLKFLIPIGTTLVGLAAYAAFGAFGPSALAPILLGFIIVVLAVNVLRLHALLKEQRDHKPPTGNEKERLCEELRRRLAQIPELRKTSLLVSAQRTGLLKWRQRTLVLLQRAYGGYTGEVQEFEEIHFEGGLGSPAILNRGLDNAEAIIATVIEDVLDCSESRHQATLRQGEDNRQHARNIRPSSP